jgi:hypothetical protein
MLRVGLRKANSIPSSGFALTVLTSGQRCQTPQLFFATRGILLRSLGFRRFFASSQLAMADTSGKGLLLKSDQIADIYRDEIHSVLKSRSSPPKLVGILSTSAAPSKFYAEFTQKQCDALGITFELRKTGAALGPERGLGEGEGAEEAIIEANEDPSVDGIMVSTGRPDSK